MSLQVVGAGLGRTGTLSLKLALERLLGGPCYHMMEVFPRPEHARMWRDAVHGNAPDWDQLFDGFVACVDWPAAAFWRELADTYPDALILLSLRDPDSWWLSADRTILEGAFRRWKGTPDDPWHAMARDLFAKRFTENYLDEDAAKTAFERHNANVRAAAPAERLVVWNIGDGWQPLCDALGLPVPDEAFPHANTTEEFRSRAGFS